MNKVKTYFKEESKWSMLGLEHPKPSDFYISVWQSNRSPVLLLIFRSCLFIASLAIMLSSMILYILAGIFGYWFIYLTHWGLFLNVFATGFAAGVSARSYFYGPISAEFCLPWYVKTYWVLYNEANPISYLITIFYWTILFEAGVTEELNPGLDVAVHALNTVVILFLLMTSRQPSRLLHVYQPLIYGLTYVAFGLIYWLAGGTDPDGNPWIYSVINWSRPGPTIGVLCLTGLLLVGLHLATVGMAAARDGVTARWLRPSVTVHVEEGMALRHPERTEQS